MSVPVIKHVIFMTGADMLYIPETLYNLLNDCFNKRSIGIKIFKTISI